MVTSGDFGGGVHAGIVDHHQLGNRQGLRAHRLKGSPEGWVAVVKPGRVMFELAGVPEPLAREAMRLAGHKLPVKTKFILREGATSVIEGGPQE